MNDYGYYSNYQPGGTPPGGAASLYQSGRYGYYPQAPGQFGGGVNNPQYGQYGGMTPWGSYPQPQTYDNNNIMADNRAAYDKWVAETTKNWQGPAPYVSPEYHPETDYRGIGNPALRRGLAGAYGYGYGGYNGGADVYGQNGARPTEYPRNGNGGYPYSQQQPQVTDWMNRLMQAYQSSTDGGGGGTVTAPQYQQWTPPGDFQQAAYQAPSAWDPGSIETPGVIDTQQVIDSFQPQINEARDQQFADAGARFGQLGMLQSGGGGSGYADALGAASRKATNDLANLQYQYKYGAAEQAAARQQQAQQAALDRSLSSWGQQGNWQYGGDMADRSNAYDQWKTTAALGQDAWSQGNQWNQNMYGLGLNAQQQAFDQQQQRYQQLLQLMQMGQSWL